MSVWDLKVTLFIFASIGVAIAAFPRLLSDKLSIHAIAFWVMVVPLLTIVQLPVVTFLVLVGALLYLQKLFSPVQRLFLFIALMAAVPVWFKYTLSAGATDIFVFRYWKVLIFCMLVPLIPHVLAQKSKLDSVDVIFVVFVVFLAIQYLFFDERSELLTNIRLVIDVILFHLVTYIVVSRVISQQPREALLYVSYGFVIMGLILAGVFIFNQILQADLYGVHSTAGNVYNSGYLREYRSGFLRTEGPLAGEAMGLVLAAAAGSLFLLRNTFGFTTFKLLSLMGVFTLACVTTGSRGVLFSYLLIAAVFIFFRSGGIAKIFLVVAAIALFLAVTFGTTSYDDEYGTFDFRVQLFEASFKFLSEYPFGDVLYASHPYFDHMRRGSTQFLDIVSVYLQYVLPYGYLGLTLYVAPFVITILQLLKISMFEPSKAGIYREMMIFYIALLVGYLFMISTVSSVGLIDLLGLIFLAIGRGVIISARNAYQNEMATG